jgi:glycosyltransferase involved in cell wall biosynthesis
MPCRIASVNLAFDHSLDTPYALLSVYHSLTGWTRALAGAGASVHVIQRFAADARDVRDGATYEFVADGVDGMPRPWSRHGQVVAAVKRARPDLVHVNGLMFPGTLRALRPALGSATPIVLQDHSGALPRRLPWPVGSLARQRWHRAFQAATACTFTARELATRWFRAGLPRHILIVEIPEASTDLRPIDQRLAAQRTGLSGSPLILSVGRLDANKDPLTVLDALELAFAKLPDARAALITPGGPLASVVRTRIARSPMLRARVSVAGPVSRARIHEYYSAADLFVSGSHHEGSGYALIEALACGVTPCVTDIPAFRALAGGDGACWTPGDAVGCADSLVSRAATVSTAARAAWRRRFDAVLHWDVIADRTLEIYRELIAATRGRA